MIEIKDHHVVDEVVKLMKEGVDNFKKIIEKITIDGTSKKRDDKSKYLSDYDVYLEWF